MELADFIVMDLDDKIWAGRIYSELIADGKEFVRKKNIATAIMKNLKDEKWVKEILTELEEDAETSSDYIKLASSVYAILGDEGWTRDLFQSAQVHCKDRFCLLTLSGKILKTLADREWAAELYEKVAGQCRDRYKCGHLLQVMESQTGDMALIKNMHTKLEKNMSAAGDFIFLAESVVYNFDDKKWGRKLYLKASDADDYLPLKFELAAGIEKNLGDIGWASRIRG
jgi:hypothetical protein